MAARVRIPVAMYFYSTTSPSLEKCEWCWFQGSTPEGNKTSLISRTQVRYSRESSHVVGKILLLHASQICVLGKQNTSPGYSVICDG